jgi:hypothetical protein
MCIVFFCIGRGRAYVAFNRDEDSAREFVLARPGPGPIFSVDKPSGGSWYCLHP